MKCSVAVNVLLVHVFADMKALSASRGKKEANDVVLVFTM
jgi:hypothetical protein